jgi:Sec-independent protein secretion pathway component TatC
MTHTPPSDDSLLVHLLVVSVAFQVPVLVVSAWPPSDDSLLVHLLVVSVAFQVPVLVVSAWRLVVFNLYQ